MVQTLQRNLVEKMYFDIVFNLSLHHVGEFEPCQTRFNIFTLFLSPSWRLGPKNHCFCQCYFTIMAELAYAAWLTFWAD